MGSSIIKYAFLEARQRLGGVNLSLQRLGVDIWWQGRGGLQLSKLRNHIRTMMKFEDPPSHSVVHIGCNDLGNISLCHLHYQLVQFMSWLSNQLSETTLIWSQILSRLKWRYSENTDIMDKYRRRLNSSIGAYMIRHGGCYFRYPDITTTHEFISTDDVHLTKLGSSIFLNIIQGAIISRGMRVSLFQMTPLKEMGCSFVFGYARYISS